MRISGNYLDRLLYNVLPTAFLVGLISGLLSSDHLRTFFVLGGIILVTVWLVDAGIIFGKFGAKLNKLVLKDHLVLNERVIVPAQIMKIKTENIYPDSIVAKWRISTIRLTLSDNSDIYILAKPHSFFFYIRYLAGILWRYYKDRRRYKSGVQKGFAPLSSYFLAETSKTLNALTAKFPELKMKVF